MQSEIRLPPRSLRSLPPKGASVPSQRPGGTEVGTTLLPIARAAIAQALGRDLVAPEHAPWLQEPGACFVTLTQGGQLRGCIGSLQARRSIRDDVRANAVAAALRDPRFAPLRLAELEQTQIAVSVLSPMRAMRFDSEADALAQLTPGVDGLVLEFGAHRSTFLPQVWKQLPTVDSFMTELKRKAGLAADFWAAGIRLQRYTVAKWEESPDDARHAATQQETRP